LAATKDLPIFLLGFTFRVVVVAIVPIFSGKEGLGRCQVFPPSTFFASRSVTISGGKRQP
jgi:hypothetical protein